MGARSKTPLVSVLLPARNAAPTLGRALDSILGQSLSDLELVAIDDASTDETALLLAAYAQRDARVRAVRAPGRGLVTALNLGLAACRAPFIARMDADDESLPDRLARSVAALEAQPELGAVGTGVEMFREDQPLSPNMGLYIQWLNGLTSPEQLFADRLVESPLCHPSATVRRTALEQVGGWREGPFPEDWELWLALLSRGWRLEALPEVLFRWRDHPQRLTRTDPRYAPRALTALKARHLARETLRPAGRACVLWGAGRNGLDLFWALRAEGVRVSQLIDLNPRKLGQRIGGVPVVPPEALGPPGDAHLVVCVGAKGARAEIRAFLQARGWVEGVHCTLAA